MGAINYKSNKYINLGYDLSNDNILVNNIDLYDDDNDRQDLYDDICFTYDDIKDLIDQYDLYYIYVKAEPGYYEGFYIDIDFDYSFFNDYQEKQTVLKEITKLKHLLFEIVNNYKIVNCHNSWCTTYDTKEETKQEIKAAIYKLRQETKQTPTAKNYFKKWCA